MHTDKGETKKSRKDIVSATYEGILTITDLEKFKASLINGIGKKKAYGCGFLTIIPENEKYSRSKKDRTVRTAKNI